MPIKFRCNYCRQFLGISRAQAGGIVDCPTCGRSIRVPQLDGSLQPLPEPELNLQDAQLARALDELARLSGGESVPVSVSFEPADEDEAENEFPQLIPEPIPIEVPIPPTPIAINPPSQDDDELPVPDSQGPPTADSARVSLNMLAELASLSPPVAIPGSENAESPDAQPPRPSAERRPLPVRSSLPQVSLLIVLAFIAGMLFERFVKVMESFQSPPATATTTDPAADPAPVASSVTGRITYKSAEGTSQPDRGARIIAFPVQREGEAKLSVVGFRPADGDIDAKLAAATLRALGGALTSADDTGQFRLELPAGSYQLLVLSHFQSREDNEPADPALQKLLASFFDKPAELIGRVAYSFGPLKVKGTGDVFDHSF
ncbi:MAG: hypothetical protein JSS49_12325 [Planctomycetes bacterium]|nr:hypothetical protein [Planctomycetota bacterium]